MIGGEIRNLTSLRMDERRSSLAPSTPFAPGAAETLRTALSVRVGAVGTSPGAAAGAAGAVTGGGGASTGPAGFITLGEFKRNDVHPRRQRHYLLALKRLQVRLVSGTAEPQDAVPPLSHSALFTSAGVTTAGSAMESGGGGTSKKKMRSRDIELPFKRASQGKVSSRINALLSKKKSRHSPTVAFHLLQLAIMDDKEELAVAHLEDIPDTFFKKKRPFESNTVFLLAMAHRMEKLALMIVDRGFPGNVNAPIFTMNTSKKYADTIPFRINASMFPSYFIVAIALGLESLVRFMIKRGASLTKSWYGLTPLHVASICVNGQPHMGLVQTLLEYGADPWKGVNVEQYQLLLKLKKVMPVDPPQLATSLSRDRSARSSTTSSDYVALKNIPAPPSSSIPLALQNVFLPPDQDATKIQQAPIASTSSNVPSTLASQLHPMTVFPILSIPQRLPQSYRSHRPSFISTSSQNSLDRALSRPQTSNVATMPQLMSSEEWIKGRVILPLAFAVSTGNRIASVSILQRMQNSKPRSSVSSPTSASATALSLFSSSSSSRRVPPHLQDQFCLLIQQDPEMYIYLLKSGVVDINQVDPRGSTALHLAIRTQAMDCILLLLHFDDANGRLMNARGENGWTALHEAISRRNLQIVRLLVKRNAIDVENNLGDTARVLGKKVGIDWDEIENVWFASLKGSNAIEATASTIAPGSVASDLMNALDPRLLNILYGTSAGSLFYNQTSSASSSGSLGGKAFGRRKDKGYSQDDSAMLFSSNIPSSYHTYHGQSGAGPPPNLLALIQSLPTTDATNSPSRPKRRSLVTSSMAPFRKILGKSSSKKKEEGKNDEDVTNVSSPLVTVTQPTPPSDSSTST